MMQLKCKTKNCQHNLKCHCGAGMITIDNNGKCASKIKRPGGAMEQTFAEIEAADDIIESTPQIIQCDADCIYNENHRCTATSLLINDGLLNTKCATRIKK